MDFPAVFFFPHQDDELITQGCGIQSHLAAGREVVVVSMSDGQASGVRNILKGDYDIDLSYAAFSKARDREVLDSLTRLGVKRENIYFENLEDGGGYTISAVNAKIRKYIAKFGVASYKTHSWMDAHRDHHMLGKSLDILNRKGEVPNGDARFYRSWRYPDAPTPGGSWNNTTDQAQLNYASDAYRVWAPDEFAVSTDMGSGPRYSIGALSVGETELKQGVEAGRVWVHQDSSNYSTAKRAEANDWLKAQGHPAYL